MEKKDFVYIAIIIGGYIFCVIFIFIPVINLMISSQIHPAIFILTVTLILPLISLGMLYLLLDYYKRISKTSRKEKIDEVILDKSKEPTDREMMEDWDFENKKRIVLSAIRQVSKRIDTSIIYFEEVSETTSIEEGEIEDIVAILLAEGHIDGDIYFDEEDKGCIKLKTREYKVKFEKNKKK